MITIKVLSPDNWQLYKSLRLEALQLEPQAFCSSFAETSIKPESFWRDRLESAASEKDDWLLFASEGDRLIGMICAYSEDDPSVIEVVSVYVTKDARGRGVAKQLMASLLGTLAAQEVTGTARLIVNKDQVAAIALYKHFGFEIVREDEAVMGDGKLHAQYIMERDLVHDAL